VSLAVDDGATVTPLPPEPATWLAIGDSITQGMTCASPARTYAGLAARALGISHHNTAVGGARMEPGAGQVAGIEATFATAAFGCNDWNGGKPLAQFAADTAAFLETLFAARPGLPLGLITPFPAVGDRGERNAAAVDLEAYRDVVRRQAAAHPSVRLIEGPSLIPAEAAFFADGIHPNDAGMAVIAERLAPHLRTLQAAARPAA
jgi:lysophospholipase L1-like esterase